MAALPRLGDFFKPNPVFIAKLGAVTRELGLRGHDHGNHSVNVIAFGAFFHPVRADDSAQNDRLWSWVYRRCDFAGTERYVGAEH